MSGINRVGPGGKKIEKEESAPGTKEFEEIMKIEKTKEVERIEPGEKRKRRLKRPQEEEASSLQAPSPYEVQKPSSASLSGPAEIAPPSSKEEPPPAPPPAPKEKEPTPPLQEKPHIEEDLPTSPEFWEENLPPEEAEAKKKGKTEKAKMPLKEMLGEKIGDKILKEGLIPTTEAPTKGKKKKAPLLQAAETKELPSSKEVKAKSPLEVVVPTAKQKKASAVPEKEMSPVTTIKSPKKTLKTKLSAEEKPLPKMEEKEKEEEIVLPPMKEKEGSTVIVEPEKLSETELETLTRRRPLFEKKETAELEAKEKKEFEEEKRKGPKVLFTTLDAVPPQAQAQAAQVSSQLMPYLSPEILPLFEKMVGMIIYVAQEGYSRTEFILNAPSLSDSVFFGCKIVLEKYATAPNSFNIRLIGGTEAAVQLFTANAENLAQAFKQGEFDFNIGRIEAEFEPTRPLIRRKSGAREKEEKK